MSTTRNFGGNCSAFGVIHSLERTPTGPDWANLHTGRAGGCGLFRWVAAQTERVQDWHSLDRHGDIRVQLAGHVENTTCLLLACLPKTEDLPSWDEYISTQHRDIRPCQVPFLIRRCAV